MRIFILSIILILNFVLQSTIFEYIEIFGVIPNTTIIIIASFAILRYEIEGAIIGFFAGLLQDIFFGNVIGLNALLYMLIGYMCGKPFKDFYSENYLLPILLVSGGTFFYNFSYYILNFLFRGRIAFLHYLRLTILPEIFYNIMLSLPIYGLVYIINTYLENYEKPKRKVF